MIVIGIAAVVMISGAVAAGLTGGTPAPVKNSVVTAKGSPLRAVAARPLLSSMISDGLPPNDILAAMTVPSGTTTVPKSWVDNGLGAYDESIGLSVVASEQEVIGFFRAQLPSYRWHLLSQGPAANVRGYQIVGQHPGSDGYEWELGVTVMPETFPSASSDVGNGTSSSNGTAAANGSSSSKGTTPITLRLFEVTDAQ